VTYFCCCAVFWQAGIVFVYSCQATRAVRIELFYCSSTLSSILASTDTEKSHAHCATFIFAVARLH